MKRAKVFGIGFHKTGTKSLGSALEVLGYRVCGPQWTAETDIAQTALARALALVPEYDAFQDNPWAVLYNDLDHAFPGSKFILTEEPTDRWLARTVRYFGMKQTPMRSWIYGFGSPVGNEAVYAERYEAHNRAVRDHFRDRPDDLLVFPLISSPEWAPMCQFLGTPVPQEIPFPHRNKDPG